MQDKPEGILYKFPNVLYNVILHYWDYDNDEMTELNLITLPSIEQARYFQLNYVSLEEETLAYVEILATPLM